MDGGTDPGEIAVLVRVNAQLPPIEQALTRAGIPFRVRGQRFFARREVRDARQLLGRARPAETGSALVGAIRELFAERLGLEPAGDVGGREGEERSASLQLIVEIASGLAAADPGIDVAGVLAELDRRDAAEAAGSKSGVNLLTYHRAKGLEWDAVWLPALEEGLLPIRQAKDDESVAEERRLLYVGITRARRLLALSWAQRRAGVSGKEARRQRSRFLDAIDAAGPSEHRRDGDRRAATEPRSGSERRVSVLVAAGADAGDDVAGRRVLEGLYHWRRDRSRADAVPAYVVAHDATLLAIAEARPASIAALRRVHGMGPAKLDRYGAEILAVIAASVEPPAP